MTRLHLWLAKPTSVKTVGFAYRSDSLNHVQVGYYQIHRFLLGGSWNFSNMGNFLSARKDQNESNARWGFMGFRCIILGRAEYE